MMMWIIGFMVMGGDIEQKEKGIGFWGLVFLFALWSYFLGDTVAGHVEISGKGKGAGTGTR